MADLALSNRFWKRFAAALAALVILYALQSAWTRSLVRPNVSDFRVVYCGERAFVRHIDPYRVEPLRTCEHDIGFEAGEAAWSVTPFPLPSYAAAALSPLAYVPFKFARVIWIALLVVSFALAAAAVASLIGVPAFAVGLVFAPTLGVLNLQYGEPVLISVGALCLAALAVHTRRPQLAAIAAAASMIEPHVGLPAALGVFVFVPAARRTLALAAAVLAVVGFVTMGAGTNLEYVRGFLPAQAQAELLAADQFSLSRLLYVLGAAPQAALSLGSLSYACTTVIGLFVARLLVRRSFTPGLYVLAPVATAMIGGPFIHDVQIAAALPATFVLAQRYWTGRIGIALLALEWAAPVTHLIVPALTAAAGASVLLKEATPGRRAIYAAAVTVGTLALALLLPLHQPALAATTPLAAPLSAAPLAAAPLTTAPALAAAPGVAAAPPLTAVPAFEVTDLSSIPWGWRIKTTAGWSEDSLRTAIVKLPIWAGLLLVPLSLLSLKTARKRQDVATLVTRDTPRPVIERDASLI